MELWIPKLGKHSVTARKNAEAITFLLFLTHHFQVYTSHNLSWFIGKSVELGTPVQMIIYCDPQDLFRVATYQYSHPFGKYGLNCPWILHSWTWHLAIFKYILYAWALINQNPDYSILITSPLHYSPSNDIYEYMLSENVLQVFSTILCFCFIFFAINFLWFPSLFLFVYTFFNSEFTQLTSRIFSW